MAALLQDKEDLCWWQPVPYATVDLEGEPVTRHRAWLPHAIAVTADPEGWTVAVQVGPGYECGVLQSAEGCCVLCCCRAQRATFDTRACSDL